MTRCIGKRKSFLFSESIIGKTLLFIHSVDGGFSPWSEWSQCSKSCGNGDMTRSRTCTDPSPSIPEPETVSDDLSFAGMNCTGDFTQVKTCNEKACKIN